MITYDWLSSEQIEWLVNPVLQLKGMALLNPDCCRVLGAWDNGRLIESFAINLFPVLGPMVKHDNLHRDNGEVSRELTTKMYEYLVQSNARGYLVVAESPVTRRLCERHGMNKLASPVYVADCKSLECNDYTTSKVIQ